LREYAAEEQTAEHIGRIICWSYRCRDVLHATLDVNSQPLLSSNVVWRAKYGKS